MSQHDPNLASGPLVIYYAVMACAVALGGIFFLPLGAALGWWSF